VPRNSDDKPLTPVVLERVMIVREGEPTPPTAGPQPAPTQRKP